MGKSLFIVLAVSLMMFSGAHGLSESMSCSTVNGKTICNRERNQGGTAMSSSSSSAGPQGENMNTFAGAGNPMGNWQQSGQRVQNGNGPSPSNDYFELDKADFQGGSGGFVAPIDGTCSFSSSGSTENFGTNAGPMPAVGGFGFASAGNFFPPGFPLNFAPETVDTPQVSTEPNGGPPANNNFGNGNSGSQGATGQFAGAPSPGGFSFTSSSTGSAPNFGTNVRPAPTVGGFGGSPDNRNYDNSGSQGATGVIAGGPSPGGMSFSFSSSDSAPNLGPAPTAGGFGFATAGPVFAPGFPFSFVPGFVNAPQDTSRPNGGGGYASGGFMPGGFAGTGAGAGAFAGNMPGFDPFRFVFGGRR